jgi:hypothetical protein
MFCIITPIFDEAFQATSGLIQDLKEQTYKDFQHVFISNGGSPIIEKIVKKAQDSRFIYAEYPKEETKNLESILVNIARRRNYTIANFKADRYFYFDADLLILEKTFLEVIAGLHDTAEIIISKVYLNDFILPFKPIKIGGIDIANYCFSKSIADRYDYPTEYDITKGIANDWKFYDIIKKESQCFNDMCYARKDGRQLYRNLSAKYVANMRGCYNGV